MAIRAIIFDTNAFPKGELRIGDIEDWASSCAENDAELWLPEPIALEIAHHTVQEEAKHLVNLNKFNAARRKWGLGVIRPPDPISVDGVLGLLGDAGAVILELAEDVAAEALRDQILLAGPAETKSGVKTGAADSAWVRTVAEALREEADGEVVVVTGDKRAAAFLLELTSEYGGRVEVVHHLGELLDRLGEDEALKGEALDAVLSRIREELFSGEELVSITGGPTAETFWDEAYTRVPVHYLEHQESLLEEIGVIEAVGELSRSKWANVTYGDILVVFAVQHAYAAQDPEGDALLSVHVTAWWEATLSIRSGNDGSRGGVFIDDVANLMQTDIQSYIA